MDNLTMAEIHEKLKKLEKQRLIHNKCCLNYYHKNFDNIKEKNKQRSKEYYEKRKNDPEFLKKKLETTKKSIQKKKLQESNNLGISE